MAFGLNRVELIGRLGADVTVNHLADGGRVAEMAAPLPRPYMLLAASVRSAARCSCSSRIRTNSSGGSQSSAQWPSIRLIASRNTRA